MYGQVSWYEPNKQLLSLMRQNPILANLTKLMQENSTVIRTMKYWRRILMNSKRGHGINCATDIQMVRIFGHSCTWFSIDNNRDCLTVYVHRALVFSRLMDTRLCQPGLTRAHIGILDSSVRLVRNRSNFFKQLFLFFRRILY